MTNQFRNSIIINASGSVVNSLTQGFYANPIRSDQSTTTKVGFMLYNPNSYEMTSTSVVTNAAGSAYFLPSVGTAYIKTLSKAGGTFKIDHPLDYMKDTHYLVHSFIEGPQIDLIYRGTVQLIGGNGSVDLDVHSRMTHGTFEALCRDVQCFTSNETGWGPVKGTVFGPILTVEAIDKNSTDTISWMVIAERKDPFIINTEWTDSNGKIIMEPLK